MSEIQPEAGIRDKAWVAAEFRYPLRSLLIKAGHNATSFVLLSMVVVTGGFATSGLAVAGGAEKGSGTAWVIFAIGAIVALAGAVAQIFRFGIRSNARGAMALKLREEGWNYADDKDALPKFRTRVTAIQRRIADVAKIDADGKTASPSGGEHHPAKPPKAPPEKSDQSKAPTAVGGDGGGGGDA
jgi:hypothetical protein